MTTYEEAKRQAQARVAREEKRRRARKRRLIGFAAWFIIGGITVSIPFKIVNSHNAHKWKTEKEALELQLLQKNEQLYLSNMRYNAAEDQLEQRAELLSFTINPDIPYEVQLAAHVAGDAYGIDPIFLEAVAWKESRYMKDAVNADGSCIGLMQIDPKWHTERAELLGYTVDDLWEVFPSMMVGTDYLLELFERHDDPHWVLMKYNGDSRADNYLAGRQEPSAYAREVMAKYQELLDHAGARALDHIAGGDDL